PLVHDHGLVDVVIRVAEVDDLRALLVERDLVDVEVERLRARGEGVVERHVDPLHLVLREAELLRDGVRDGALVALAAPRVADLPWLVRRAPRTRPGGGGGGGRSCGGRRYTGSV